MEQESPKTTLGVLTEPLLPLRQAAELLGWAPVTLRRRASEGVVSHYKMSGRLMFERSDLQRYISARRVAAR